MARFRKLVYLVCMCAALGYAGYVLLDIILPPKPERFTSVYPMEQIPPVMGLSEDSVINIGSAKELDKLPNIGKVLSQRIIDYREVWGDYHLLEDLIMVKGIGEKTVNGIREVLEDELVPHDE